MKSRVWMALIGVLLVVCLGLSLWLLRPGQAAFAEVWSEGELLYTLDLQVERTVTVQTEKGLNVITVRDGRIAVTEADCPDGHCMDRGFCSGGVQIVCLPHQLVIKFVQETEIDGVIG